MTILRGRGHDFSAVGLRGTMENSCQSRTRQKRGGGGGGGKGKIAVKNVMFSSSVYMPLDRSVNKVSFI